MTPPTPESLYKQLLHVCNFLDESQIPYIIIGGIAFSIWTAPRATVDLYFVIGVTEENLSSFIKSATQKGIVVFDSNPMVFKKMKLCRMFLEGKEAQLIMLDFILADDPYKKKSLERAIPLPWEGQEIKVASPEDVILLKLLSGRGQDLVEVANIIRMRKPSLDQNYLQNWAHLLSLSDSLNSVMKL